MNRFPLNGTFELTARCNLRCKMCLVRVDEPRILELGTRELTAAEWIDLARQAADMGTLNLLLTGGEPMFRKDFCEIYEAVAKMGFHLTLYTNATLITPEIRELLMRFPPHKIGVTLYGASADTYEKTCGVAEGFDRTLVGIRFLKTLPSRMSIRTTMIQDNVGDLDLIRRIVFSNRDDIGFSITNVVSRAVRGGIADAVSCRLQPMEHVRMYIDASIHTAQDLVSLNQQHRMADVIDNELTSQQKKAKYTLENVSLFGCSAGMNEYTITWNGKLIGCQMMDSEGCDVLTEGLKKSWDNYPETVSFQPISEACLRCEWKKECVSCCAIRKSETGDYSGIPEYNCTISKLMHNIDAIVDLEVAR